MNWRQRTFIPLAFSAASVVACAGEDDPKSDTSFSGGQLTLQFSGMVGDQPFECGQTYSGVGRHGSMAMGQDLRFYVSDVRLLTEDGDEVPLVLDERTPFQTPEVALLDFENGTGPCETSGNTATNDVVTGTAPEGTYVGVAFSIAVPEDLNHIDPTTAPEPLQVTAMQWNWLLGYKFLRAEMMPMMHMHGDGGAGGAGHDHGAHEGMGGASAPGHALDSQFHLGSLACSNEGNPTAPPAGSCEKPNRNEVRFEAFHPGTQVIVADLGAMMADIDLSVANHCHGMPHESCSDFYASVGLDYDSGETISGHSAFRVEDQ